MDLPQVLTLQKNHLYLKENLQVDPVLDALYQECIFTQADYDRCRQAGTEKCQLVLETLKKKGVEGYKTLCAVLDTTQHFIKERLDNTSTEAGNTNLVFVQKDKLEAMYTNELAEKEGEIADLKSAIEGLEQQVEQNNVDHAELAERMKNESDEHMSEIVKKNEEIETLKTALSKLNRELQQSRAKSDNVEKALREEQEAYDALVGVPRSPDRVDNTEQVQHAGSPETMCLFSAVSCCDERQLRLLPCLHSACKPCLDHQATQTEEKCIHCPSCGRQFTVEQTTIDHVRRNEAAYKVNADGEMKCSYIDEDHDAKAVVYCHQCDDKLCSECHKHHDTPKRNRNHSVTAINQAENILMRPWLKEPYCNDHPDNKLQLYDHTCKKAVCLICVHGAHKKHEKEDLDQAYDVAKSQLEEQVKKQEDKLRYVAKGVKTVRGHQTELVATQKRLEQAVTKVCKAVAVKFLHRQRQLMREIQMSLQAPNETVEEKLDSLHNVHTSIVSAIDYTQRTLESTRREELITLTDVLQTKCDENLKWMLPEDDTQDTRIILSFQGQKALEELIATFGTLVTSLNMDHIPDSQPTLQELKGLDSRMARLQKPEQLTSEEVYSIVTKLIVGACNPGEGIPHGITLQGDATLHNIREDRSIKFVICHNVQLDAGRANTRSCHVNTNGELVNSRPDTQHTQSGRLQRLCGTCSCAPIPLPPTPSTVTLVLPTTRYWEAHFGVGVVERGWLWPVLEVGVAEESQVDSMWHVCDQRRSWCVSVVSCDTHPGSLCTRLYLAGVWVKCYRNTMSDTPGTRSTLHYGVVLDFKRGRIGFIDVDRSVVLGRVDVTFKEDLLPIFTVGRDRHYTVNMKVVSGEKILMSDTKKSLINNVLDKEIN
ncbi:E3 ubiquitin-protein ligase Midline-1-like [Haliotis asinina]|uniref:E3 ubiquitin-protein ligase Midline-1-like n=1 Tax=Haliotis asinina TaxID=109174 RepID=UPI003531C3C7